MLKIMQNEILKQRINLLQVGDSILWIIPLKSFTKFPISEKIYFIGKNHITTKTLIFGERNLETMCIIPKKLIKLNDNELYYSFNNYIRVKRKNKIYYIYK